jgi:hypothetical protein
MSFTARPDDFRTNPHNNPRNKIRRLQRAPGQSRFAGLNNLNDQELIDLIRTYEPTSVLSLHAIGNTHELRDPDGILPVMGNPTPGRVYPCPRLHFEWGAGFGVIGRKRPGRPPVRRDASTDDLYPVLAFVAHVLLRRMKRDPDRLPILPNLGAILLVDKPAGAIPLLIELVRGEPADAETLKNQRSVFLRLRPWLRGSAKRQQAIFVGAIEAFRSRTPK